MDGLICLQKMQEAEAGYYDVILMDIQMPNMNGYKATELIRNLSDERKCNIPILAMTANAFDEDKKNAINIGMNGHLSKPIDLVELLTTLQRIMK